MRSIKEETNLNDKKILLRLDLNVPLNNKKITDTTRIDKIIPTLKFLIKHNSKIIILSHVGRPKGKFVNELSLKPICEDLENKLNLNVKLITKNINELNNKDLFKSVNEKIIMLENIRFYLEEEKNDDEFAKHLARLADIYVNDAFSCSHRAHASIYKIPNFLPSYSGLQLDMEIGALKKITSEIKKPITCIIGGSKISTKINTLLSLTTSCSDIFIGGAMANNFLKYNKFNVSSSLIEEGAERMIEMIYSSAKQTGCEIHLPVDVMLDSDQSVLVNELDKNTEFKISDIADSSHIVLENLVKKSDIILWNGPMGMIEDHKFSKGSINLSHLLAKAQADVVIGGGDTILAINMAKEKFEDFYFVSTAGGAFLEALEDKELLGIEALKADL